MTLQEMKGLVEVVSIGWMVGVTHLSGLLPLDQDVRRAIKAASAPLDFEGARQRFREALGISTQREETAQEGLRCEGLCDGFGKGPVELESSRTMYVWDGQGEDPNRPRALCRDCAKLHHEEWDTAWREYYSGLL
jgi:hypothetical protein